MVVSIAALALISLVVAAPANGCPPVSGERYEPRSFFGYACDGDCERHKAGFAWAESLGLADRSACGSLGRRDAEGCRAYVDESLPADEAGFRWALENEIEAACLCAGAGEGFRSGCRRYVLVPINTY